MGPFQTSTPGWQGPYGEVFNALGFKTPDGQPYTGTSSVKGDPDLPNPVTINSGGMFAVAVDQVNTNPQIQIQSSPIPQNPTPDYLRNPIILSGGTLAATGHEVFFSSTGGVTTNNPVTAKLGGDFIVSPGTSTIDTFDPIGGSGARTVQLLAGTRVISNSTYSFTAGQVLTYGTTWSGTLNVDGGGYGGEFDLMRDSGGSAAVSVASGEINIQHGATVKLLNLTTDDEYWETSTGTAEEPSVRSPIRTVCFTTLRRTTA